MINESNYNKGVNTFTITSQPFYDQYNQCYKNIMMVNVEPSGPLRKNIRRIKLPKLSPFQREGPCNPIPQCGLAIQNLHGTQYTGTRGCKLNFGCNLMTPNELPELIAFLISNNYQIETQLTNMLNQSDVKLTNRKLSFIVTYYGTNQPNTTYIR